MSGGASATAALYQACAAYDVGLDKILRDAAEILVEAPSEPDARQVVALVLLTQSPEKAAFIAATAILRLARLSGGSLDTPGDADG